MIGALFAATALLLVHAGAAKVRDPAAAAAMLRRAGSPLGGSGMLPVAVRAAGLVEAGVGASAALVGSRLTAVAVVCCYLAFAGVTVRLLRHAPRTSCGCFGRTSSPVGPAHLVLNLVAAGIAIAAAARPPRAFDGLLDGGVVHSLAGATQAGVLAYLGFLSITALPALSAARRRLEMS